MHSRFVQRWHRAPQLFRVPLLSVLESLGFWRGILALKVILAAWIGDLGAEKLKSALVVLVQLHGRPK